MKQFNQGQFTPDGGSAAILARSSGRTTLKANWRARLAAVLGAALLAVSIATGLGGPTSALADKKVDEYYYPDTDTIVELYENAEGKLWAWVTYSNGEIEINTFDNPNPEDDGRGQVYSPDNVRDFLAQFGGATDPPQDRWDNPLGVELTQQGEGIIPAHNPADVVKTYDDGTGIGGSAPFDPNGGDFTDQLKKNGTGGGDDSDDDDSDDPDRGEVGLFDEDMPGPPPLVNPAPVVRISR